MNFFDHQDRARRRTGRLVVLFCLAVLIILLAVNVAAYYIARLTGAVDRFQRDAGVVFREELRYPGRFAEDRTPGPMPLFAATTGVTLLIILGGSAYKTVMLSRGGPAVAQMLGGRPLIPESDNPREKLLQNVVEEMSIASGVPVPQVWILDREEAINAFAAGFTTDDAVIGVTRGTLTRLNRDELQGVIAHEFSHILNGDMRLNIRLIGILHGILLIALIGYLVLRLVPYTPSSGRRGRSNDGGNVFILLMIAGAAMVVIGWIGVFFGRLIQAAVSRQREYLADASAVQFTRNPAGLVGALKKIGKFSAGARVENAHALETAHLFFGSAMKIGFTGLLATHPPLEKRIKAIDPSFDGRFEIGPGMTQVLDEVAAAKRGEALADMVGLAAAPARAELDPSSVASRAGQTTPRQLAFAAGLVGALPPALVSAAHSAFSARAVALALLLSDEPEVRQRQLSLASAQVDPACHRQLLELIAPIGALGQGAKLPLLDLALPALRQMSPSQSAAFAGAVRALIEADGRVTLFEFALHRILEKQLSSATGAKAQSIQFYSVRSVRQEAAVVLSALAAASSADTERAFQAGARALDSEHRLEMAPVDGLKSIDVALKKLARSSPAVKRRLLDGAAHAIAADGYVNVTEAELLRATAATLDVPLPPLFSALPASAA